MAPLTAGPAAEVTLDRPCEALEVILEADSFDLAAALEAASVVEACRRACWRAMKRVCRSTRRDAVGADIKESRHRFPVVASESKDWLSAVQMIDRQAVVRIGQDLTASEQKLEFLRELWE